MPNFMAPRNLRCELSPRALDMWNPGLRAAVEQTSNTITIYGVIGEDWYSEGVTLKRIDAALRTIGDKEVTVYINSPGGDMFEGIAIYNRLREHSQKVTTKVIGIAASAGSVIAMAGEERLIAKSAFLMIHNCWLYAVGNRHELRDIADQIEPFDQAMVELYADASGQSTEAVAAMLDAETYINGTGAVDQGFATGLLSADEISEAPEQAGAQASRQMDMALAKAGMPRSERRKLIQAFKSSMPSAAGGDTPRAVPADTPRAVAPDLSASLSAANAILSNIGGNHA